MLHNKYDYLPGVYCRACGKECKIKTVTVGYNPLDGHPIVKDLATCPSRRWWKLDHHEHNVPVYTKEKATEDSKKPKGEIDGKQNL
jgi:hypothetical protein